MLTNCEQKIMEIVMPQPFKTYSVRALSRLIKSSYALTYDSIMALIDKGLIRSEKIGKSLACRLNLSAKP